MNTTFEYVINDELMIILVQTAVFIKFSQSRFLIHILRFIHGSL